jgi:hypothetical protein
MEGGDFPIDRGDFVWTNFPTREEPALPATARHVALCLRRFRSADKGYALVAVYTTSRPRGDRPRARGEIEVTAERAAEYGQRTAFRIDVRRVAALPINPDFFPELEKPGHGIQGRSERLADVAERLLREIVTETPELVEFLGPENVLRSVFGRRPRSAR